MEAHRDLEAALAAVEHAISESSSVDLPALMGDLARLAARATARLLGTCPGPPAADETLLTIPQVAARLQISRAYAYELVRLGRLPSVKVGAKYVRVRRQDLETWLTAGGPPVDVVIYRQHSGAHDGLRPSRPPEVPAGAHRRNGRGVEFRGALGTQRDRDRGADRPLRASAPSASPPLV